MDLRDYTENEIYEMLSDGTITIDDLDYYIKNGYIDSKTLGTYVKYGLIDKKDLKPYIETGVINTQAVASLINQNIIAVKDVEDYIKNGNINPQTLATELKDANDTNQVVETIEQVQQQQVESPAEPAVEVAEEKPPVPPETPEPVVEEVEPQIEEPEEVVVDAPNQLEEQEELKNSANDERFYANTAVDETYNYGIRAGMSVNEVSLDGKGGHGPYISFEINYASSQMLNHLMNKMSDQDGISMEFMRDLSTKRELFTIEMNRGNMTDEEFMIHVKSTFEKISETIQTTRNDIDYEHTMNAGLKNVKDRFRNDDPDIDQDFIIGYVRNDGKDSYYIVATTDKAVEYARSIGYEIKNSQGANIFELETNGHVVGTKLESAATDLSNENFDLSEDGMSELDIYGSIEEDPRVQTIENFIETSNDPHLMCILEVEVPTNNPNQRIVTMATEMGGRESVVFTDGTNFDNKVMPRIIETYAENNGINPENLTTTSPDALDHASLELLSENNTTLKLNGYSSSETNKIADSINSKANEKQTTNEYTNSRQKTLGTYPNQNENKAAFVSMPVLIAVCIFFVFLILLIIFTR